MKLCSEKGAETTPGNPEKNEHPDLQVTGTVATALAGMNLYQCVSEGER